jgi:tRNA(fMet)-specific endonuclease VapC
MIIADSDVLIDFFRGKTSAERIEQELRKGRVCTTVITAFELWAGAKQQNQMRSVDILLLALPIINLDSQSAKRAGELRDTLEQKGITIGMADSLIAGICLENKAKLLTRNVKHFSRVDGLKLLESVFESVDE